MRAALALLTVVPVGRRGLPGAGRTTLLVFPLVGTLVGLVWVATAGAGQAVWGTAVAAVLVLTADAIVTGGLHLDGVADVGDVVGSRRRGAAALEVARDPHTGALGALTLVVVVLLRVALVAVLLDAGRLWALLAIPVVGRVAMLQAVLRTDAAEASSVAPLATAATAPVVVGGGLVAFGVLAVAGGDVVGAAAAVAVAALVVEAATAAWRRRVGAASGDLVGACGVLAELVALGALAAG